MPRGSAPIFEPPTPPAPPRETTRPSVRPRGPIAECAWSAANAGTPAAQGPRAIRWALAFAGILCVGLAAIGAVVPGMPTTVFLIAACWCFTRSCPWLEDTLVRNRFFGPFLRYLKPGAVMPMRARLLTLAILWASIGLSTALLISRDRPLWVVCVVVVAGAVGSVCVWRVARPHPSKAAR